MQKIRGIYKLLGFMVILAFHVTRVIIKSIWAGKDPNFAWSIVQDCARGEAKWLKIKIDWQTMAIAAFANSQHLMYRDDFLA